MSENCPYHMNLKYNPEQEDYSSEEKAQNGALYDLMEQEKLVKELHTQLEEARAVRRALMRRAADAGVSLYEIAKQTKLSYSVVWRQCRNPTHKEW